MNANGSLLGIGIEESSGICQDESGAVHRTKRQVEAGLTLPQSSPRYSCESSNQHRSQTSIQQQTDDLEARANQSQERTKGESSTSLRKRNLGVCDGNENFRDSPSAVVNLTSIVLRPVQVKELVNQAGLGNILSERQLFRYRKELPEMETDDGGIHLVRFIAALCKRRTRSKKNLKKSHLSLHELFGLLEDQDYRCALTGKVLSPDDVAVDHIIPISSGGDFSIKNSQLVSKSANRAKHTMSQEEFLELCRAVSDTQRSKRIRNQ
jgi:5-methylcytosine-specific restriction endonuclease McrA